MISDGLKPSHFNTIVLQEVLDTQHKQILSETLDSISETVNSYYGQVTLAELAYCQIGADLLIVRDKLKAMKSVSQLAIPLLHDLAINSDEFLAVLVIWEQKWREVFDEAGLVYDKLFDKSAAAEEILAQSQSVRN